ncbi:hypothetical protein AWENTII_003259 [Aspergillus wentii]|nr:hypothetical protein MW887_012064 [Aspergillus wentii]
MHLNALFLAPLAAVALAAPTPAGPVKPRSTVVSYPPPGPITSSSQNSNTYAQLKADGGKCYVHVENLHGCTGNSGAIANNNNGNCEEFDDVNGLEIQGLCGGPYDSNASVSLFFKNIAYKEGHAPLSNGRTGELHFVNKENQEGTFKFDNLKVGAKSNLLENIKRG